MHALVLTEEQKVKAISSVYSNIKKLKIATHIYKMKECSANELSKHTGMPAPRITEYLKEMSENGILNSRRDSYFVYYSLTDLGTKIVTLFN
jgi:DNA-binding MarR family transcriptional regulator